MVVAQPLRNPDGSSSQNQIRGDLLDLISTPPRVPPNNVFVTSRILWYGHLDQFYMDNADGQNADNQFSTICYRSIDYVITPYK